MLKNQDMYNEMVKNAETKVMDNFTWYNAAEAVVKLAESAAVQ